MFDKTKLEKYKAIIEEEGMKEILFSDNIRLEITEKHFLLEKVENCEETKGLYGTTLGLFIGSDNWVDFKHEVLEYFRG